MSIARVPEAHEIRPVNEWHARPCSQEDLAALFCRLLEPSFANQRLKALDDRRKLGPVAEDLMGEGFRKSASLDEVDILGHGKVQAFVQAAAFAIALVWCDFLVHIRCHLVGVARVLQSALGCSS